MLDSFEVHLRRSNLPRLRVYINCFWSIRASSIELASENVINIKISQYSSLNLSGYFRKLAHSRKDRIK